MLGNLGLLLLQQTHLDTKHARCCIALACTHSNAIFVPFLFSPPAPDGETESRDRRVRRCRITSYADLPLPRTKFQIIGCPAWADLENLERGVDVPLEYPQAHELLDQFRKTRVFRCGKGDPIRSGL